MQLPWRIQVWSARLLDWHSVCFDYLYIKTSFQNPRSLIPSTISLPSDLNRNWRMWEAVGGASLPQPQLSYSWDLRCTFALYASSACDIPDDHFSLAGLSQVISDVAFTSFFPFNPLLNSVWVCKPKKSGSEISSIKTLSLYKFHPKFAKCFLSSFILLNAS